MDESKQSSSGLEFKLHPLVLINISDHHTRIKYNYPTAEPSPVFGCLLGSQSGRTVDVSNSFEIKHSVTANGFEFDQPFLVRKQEQYKQVFPKLDVVGWYATGSELQDLHMELNKKIMEINESPAFLLLDPKIDHTRKDLPANLYETELHVVEGVPSIIFVRSNYTLETSDAERIGVDQVAKILPSGKATGSEQLTAHLMGMHSAIKMLTTRVKLIEQLLEKVQSGEVPYPHSVLREIASLVHSLPAIDTPRFHKDYLTEFNDTLLSTYLSTITKGVHTLNEIVDKFNVAYERTSRRRAIM